ncbi:MAG: helix-turn-helix transcriptional regulator [bacterium]|nr:helix-turn-helix transcriptional regulator [bacterium]
MKNNLKAIGKRIKEVRQKLNISMEDLTTDLSRGMISMIEKGKYAPSFPIVLALLRRGIRLEWVLFGEGEMQRETKRGNLEGVEMSEEFRQHIEYYKDDRFRLRMLYLAKTDPEIKNILNNS